MEQIAKLKGMRACREALDWLETQLDWDTAWASCQRGDWMLWLLGRLSGESGSDGRRKLVLTACACARLALPCVPRYEVRPLRAIETAEAWAQGQADITLYDEQAAAYAAYTAWAAYPASYAAWAAAYAAVNAAAAAWAAAYAASAASESGHKSTLAVCADIVRTYYPDAPMGDRPDAG